MLATLPSHPPLGHVPPVTDYEASAARWLAEEVAEHLPRDHGLKVELLTPHEYASAALLDAAGPSALLVVGARGQGGFSGLLLGSVAAQCARHTRGPLVVVHDRA